MCDYSLKGVKSRPAVVGDKITTHNFMTGTNGFRATNDKGAAASATAICVLPGTELSFDKAIRTVTTNPIEAMVSATKRIIGVPPKATERVATFIQVDQQHKDRHHDALEFPDGNIVLLTTLFAGQEATILTLPAKPTNKVEKERQERAEYV